MRTYLCSIFLILLLSSCFDRQKGKGVQELLSNQYNLNIDDMRVRDPFIFVNQSDTSYYLHVNSNNKKIICYKSKDLATWQLCGDSFVPNDDFWGKKDFWAPDLYYYKEKYYLFVTVSSPIHKRGVSILVSEYPDKEFKPLTNNSITPLEWMCIDGSLYIDNEGMPWLLYCREWVEVGNGEIYAQQLNKDLTRTVGEPILLLIASSAEWVGLISTGISVGKVTNSPFIYRQENGKLLLTWSSFKKNGEYAIGKAVSASGKLNGPWIHSAKPLSDDGGHAMLFKDLKGHMILCYHTNDLPERIVLRHVKVFDEDIVFID